MKALRPSQRAAEPEASSLQTAEAILQLYREKYFDFNVRHFHEKLREEHGIGLSYTDGEDRSIESG